MNYLLSCEEVECKQYLFNDDSSVGLRKSAHLAISRIFQYSHQSALGLVLKDNKHR